MATALKTTVLMQKLPDLKQRLAADGDLMENLEARVRHAVDHHDNEWQKKRQKKLDFTERQKAAKKR